MVAAMERISGLSFVYEHFADTSITATVLEKPSSSGFRDRSGMELRASYPPDTKRATLIHELGHRLMAGVYGGDEEEHGALFLWVYDVWVALYGKAFADEQVVVERRRARSLPAGLGRGHASHLGRTCGTLAGDSRRQVAATSIVRQAGQLLDASRDDAPVDEQFRRGRSGRLKPARPRAARIHVEHAVALEDERLVRVAETTTRMPAARGSMSSAFRSWRT